MPNPEENIIKRTPPHNEEMEQYVLGSMLLDPEAARAAAEGLHSDDFYSRKNQQLFAAMQSLALSGSALDIGLVRARCAELGYDASVSGRENLAAIMALAPNTGNIDYYIREVRDKSRTRALIKACEKISGEAYAGTTGTDELFASSEREIVDLIQNQGSADRIAPIGEIVKEAIQDISQRNRNKQNIIGVATGYTDLDMMLAGMRPSQLVLLAARPAMGKTAFALNIAYHAAVIDQKVVAMFSLEMSSVELVDRLLAIGGHVDAQKIRTGDLDEDDVMTLLSAANRLAASGMMIDDTPGITVAEIASKCRKVKQEKGRLDLVIIDYLQLIGSNTRSDSRQNQVAEISRSLKGLAKELKVPVLALSQLSRNPETRDDHRPIMSDLRESGSIEQDADVVMFIYRDEVYNKETTRPGVAEIIVGKQRAGSTGTVELLWMGKYTSFKSLERSHRKKKE